MSQRTDLATPRATLPSIVERLRAEARVHRVMAHAPMRFLKERIERLPEAVLITDASRHYRVVNQAACALTGYTEAELLDRSLADLTPPVDRRAAERMWHQFLQSGVQTGRFTLVRKDGSRAQVHFSAAAHLFPAVHISVLRPARRKADGRPGARPL